MASDLEISVRQKYKDLTLLLIEKGITVSTMESCTAGQVASLITDTEGSSEIFRGSYVTYCNDEKVRLGVPKEIINRFGVYSEQTSKAMAKVCKNAFSVDLGIGITGSFANIDPNNEDSVPGEVYLAIATEEGTKASQITVPTGLPRPESKLYIASIVCDMILKELK